MAIKSRSTFNSRVVIAQAEAGDLSLDDIRKNIRVAENLNQRDTVSILKGIEQKIVGLRAAQRLSNTYTPGTAKWAFAELGATAVTNYSWAALDREGRVVINVWDDREGWATNAQGRWCPVLAYGARRNTDRERVQEGRAIATRTEFFKLLDVAVGSHSGIVRAIISTAEDINAIPRKRVKGSSRPWLNDDNSPVQLKIIDLDLARKTFSYELVDPAKRPRSPFGEFAPRLGSVREDRMLRAYAQEHPGNYFLEVTIAERRVDAIRVPGKSTTFSWGADFRIEMMQVVGVEIIEVKQAALRRTILDQAIGSAAALGGIPVAIIEKAASERLKQIISRYLTLLLSERAHEVFVVIFLDAQNRVLSVEELFRGTLTQTAVYPREIVKAALRHNAAAVLLAHNHPSGISEPSRADELLTQTLKRALALVDVSVLDHFVVAGGSALSFAERGLL